MDRNLGSGKSDQLLDVANYGAEWEESIKELTVSINNPAINKHAAKIILDKYMSSCPTSDLEKKILVVICPFIKNSIFKIVEEMEKQLDDSEFIRNAELTIFDEQFMEIKNLLAHWRKILQHAMNIEKAPATIESLLKYLPSTVIKICNHCKKSRIKYSKRNYPVLLQDIYQDTCAVVKDYCALFCKFKFDMCKNEDIDAFKQVITSLSDFAMCTACSIGTMVQIWRMFNVITCSKVSFLTNRKDCIDCVRGHFKVVGKNIIRLYKQIMVRRESELVTYLKCLNVLLEILTRLHQVFIKNMSQFPLKEDFICEMVPVLIEFASQHELFREWSLKSVVCHTRTEIIKCWPKTLIQFYEKSPYYITEFRSQAKKIETKNDPDYAFGFHCCLLINENPHKPEYLDMILENINNVQAKMMERLNSRTKQDTKIIEVIKSDCIYENTFSVLSHICASPETGTSFSDYEDILLKHLLGERFWSSLLVYDILIHCYIRLGKHLAFTHIQYFMMAYEILHERRDNSLAVTMLQRIIQDIYELLPEHDIQNLLNTCDSPASLLVILKSNSTGISHQKLSATYKKLITIVLPNNLSQTISNLEKQPSATNWIKLINQLTVISVSQEGHYYNLTQNLLKITSLAWKTAVEIENIHLQRIMYDLILILFDCTRIGNKTGRTGCINWKLFVELAENLIKTPVIPEYFLIKLCHYFTRNEDCLIDLYDDSELIYIPAMLIYLLENESQLVFQEALDCFDKISEKSNENFIKIISNAIAKKPKLCEAVRAFLQRQPFPQFPKKDIMPEGWQNYQKISLYFSDFAIMHECHINDVHYAKFPKLDEESLTQRIYRLTNELMTLRHIDINRVPHATVKLKNACRLILEN